jgi:hypothetical protein
MGQLIININLDLLIVAYIIVIITNVVIILVS